MLTLGFLQEQLAVRPRFCSLTPGDRGVGKPCTHDPHGL